MADILLLEPGYPNKYPPIGLMKISYFHKHIHKDYVRFAKGELPPAFNGKKWDRVYVATLFTFEWERTKKALEYALKVAKDPEQVYSGGILATLMPELIAKNFPTVKNRPGLLNKKGTLGLKYEELIDTITLDYEILDDIADQYVYPAHDAYFAYMTRGCGMKCQFCAVQILEPEYIPYVSITDSIRKIEKEFGPKKDLLLMDNNVLRSPSFDKIIDEIKELGFGKGATYINPRTGKSVQRYVDFNQGLDAFLFTPHKAERLGELALRPARIAFDHIEDEEAYKKAIKMCAYNGVTHMSNYLLYNGEDFTGKGHTYRADTPEDLFQRMKISIDLCEELTEKLGHKVSIFSFPMRYVPLSNLKRGFIGKMWNPKTIRSLQRMLIPTQGKGVGSRAFFETAFGKSREEFVKFLAMPEEHLGWRGKFIVGKNETKKETAERKKIWNENRAYLKEWERLFGALGNTKEQFINYISDNKYSAEKYTKLHKISHKKLFIHYLTIPALLTTLGSEDKKSKKLIVSYMTEEFPLMYERMIRYISNKRISASRLEGALNVFRKTLITSVIEHIDYETDKEPFIINTFINIQKNKKKKIFEFELLKCFFLYKQASVMPKRMEKEVIAAFKNLDGKRAKELLLHKFDKLPYSAQIKVKKLLKKNFGRGNNPAKAFTAVR